MSELQTPDILDNAERFDHNPAIASGHLVSQNPRGDIIPTYIGDENFTLPDKITNEPLHPISAENNAPQEQDATQESLGWETSPIIPAIKQAAALDEKERQDKQAAAKKLRESFT